MRSLRALALALVAACHTSDASSPEAPARAPLAVVHGLAGTVHALRSGAADWARVSDGDRLYEEDRLRTFSGAWARLDFRGGSSLRVEEESLIALGGGITIERGSVAGELAAGLRVRTPTLEAETTSARDIAFQ